MCKIAFARHCKTAWNASCKLIGQQDIPLCPEGRLQAATLGLTFRDSREVRIEHIVTSDLSRATETAYTVARSLALPRDRVRIDARFREVKLGQFEGMTSAEVVSVHGQGALQPPFDFTQFGGESNDDILRRLLLSVRDVQILARGSNDVANVLVVSHGWALEALFGHYTDERVKFANAEWRILAIP